MRTKDWKRYIVPALLACLALLAVALSVLQLNWIRQAADTETLAIRRQMALSAAEGIQEIRKHFVAYFDLIEEIPEGTPIGGPIEQYSDSIGIPGLIANVFAVDANAGTVVSRFGTGSPEEVLGSDYLQDLAEAENSRFRITGLSSRAMSNGIIVNLPPEQKRRPEDDGRDTIVESFLILVADVDLFNNALVAPAMSEALSDYHIRITIRGNAFYTNGDIAADRRPEIAFPLDYVLGAGVNVARLEGGLAGGSEPPSLMAGGMLMFYRFILESNSAEERAADDTRPNPDYMIEVFYPDNSLGKVIRIRTVANIAISFSVLFLLFVTALVLYRFSRRLTFQRNREQEFVAAVSHELRTPITVIKAAAGNLSDGMIREEERVKQYGQEISDQSNRLERMVEGILLYSGLGSSRKTNRTVVDLEQIVKDLESSFRSVSERTGMKFVTRFEGASKVIADLTALNLIMENLVMNGFTHGISDGGEVSLTVKSGPFGKIAIIVEDTGEGIPKHEQRRIFDPFVRGDRSITDQHPGSGLGLNLIQRVVTGMEGTITVESPYTGRGGERVSGCRFTAEFKTGSADER